MQYIYIFPKSVNVISSITFYDSVIYATILITITNNNNKRLNYNSSYYPLASLKPISPNIDVPLLSMRNTT